MDTKDKGVDILSRLGARRTGWWPEQLSFMGTVLSEQAPRWLFIQSDYFATSKSHFARMLARLSSQVLCLGGFILDQVTGEFGVWSQTKSETICDSADFVALWDHECSR
jgi:hypothetical protein